MSTSARRRLVRDLKKLQTDPPSGVNAAPLESNLLVWQAVIFGCVLLRPLCRRRLRPCFRRAANHTR